MEQAPKFLIQRERVVWGGRVESNICCAQLRSWGFICCLISDVVRFVSRWKTSCFKPHPFALSNTAPPYYYRSTIFYHLSDSEILHFALSASSHWVVSFIFQAVQDNAQILAFQLP